MSRIKSLVKAAGMVPWFLVESWSYVDGPAEFFRGVIPAGVRFTLATYKDCRRAEQWQQS